MALDADRRAQLERARAVALLRQCFDISPSSTPAAAPFGITVRSEEQAWIVSMSDDLAASGHRKFGEFSRRYICPLAGQQLDGLVQQRLSRRVGVLSEHTVKQTDPSRGRGRVITQQRVEL